MFRVTVSGPREQEASFFTVVVWRDQAEHAAQSLAKGGRPGGGRGSAAAAELDDRRRQRPIHRRGRGRGAGTEPPVGNGDDDQGDAESGPVARPTSDATVRDAGSMLAFRSGSRARG